MRENGKKLKLLQNSKTQTNFWENLKTPNVKSEIFGSLRLDIKIVMSNIHVYTYIYNVYT